ncbi:AraC family transcriptional regulator [Paenibacillus sp.]|uniref:AraC family transcriptional regulator n=1 Tax=Paenibacillus sp. TaxID=58172 RepID=UPI002811A78E|nr:AraC family transcriptional regulator [Paenibacillus sp.]
MNLSDRFLHLTTPSFPCFIYAGKSVFQLGEKHVDRIFPSFVAMFVTEGTLFFTENDKVYEIHKGEWFIQTPGWRHFGHKGATETVVYYWIHFMTPGPWEIRSSEQAECPGTYELTKPGEGIWIPESSFSLSMHYAQFPIDKWEPLLEELIDPDLHKHLFGAQSRFLQLLYEMNTLQSAAAVSSSHLLADRMYHYLKNHFHENITMKLLSDSFHFSADYLTKCFRSKYGIPPSVCITQFRMEHAKQLLLNSNRSIHEIANEVGFNDLSIFSRAFKNYQGDSPQNYRKKVFSGDFGKHRG